MVEFDTARIEHLKMLQNVIDRMTATSAAMKRYALVLAAAALALAGTAKLPLVPLFAAALMAVFWALDAQYLRQERWFRELYTEARDGRLDLFTMTPDTETRRNVPLTATLASWATLGLYLPVIAFLALCSALVPAG